MATKTTSKKKVSFEEQLAAVEKLIADMENGGLPLEETLKRYEEGVTLLASLEKELSSVKQRLTVIRRQGEDSFSEEPLQEDAE